MQKINIGNSKLQATRVGLGCWQAGLKGWGEDYGDKDIIDAIKFYVENGGNYLDTAEIYGMGHSEELIKQALSEIPKNRYIVATKVNPPHVKNYRTMERSVKGSLERLGIEKIDLYQLHWYEPYVPVSEIMHSMEKLKSEGYIDQIGVCNLSKPVLKDAVDSMKDYSIVSNQMEYSILERNIERELIPYMKEKNITLIPYSPLAKGLLTGKYNSGEIPQDNIRKGDELFNNPENRKIMKPVLDELGKMAKEKKCSMAQLSLAYLLHKNCLIIPGAKNKSQVESNMGADSVKLSKEDMERIDKISSVEFIYA
jgi:Predicted oxidoreductases (related to aryl-alcohol dehydrogenases)